MNGSQFKYASKLYKLNQLLITAKLQKALQNGTYHPKGSMKFRYRERGKERLISSIVTPDKAVNHVICDEVLTPYLQKFLQYDNSASQKGKGVAFHRRRFENDLRNYYREEGTNEGYVLFIDFSGYYANIQHEPCKAVLHELLEKSGLSDELRLITEDLMDKIFKTFEMDVSRFPDEDIQAMMNGKVDPFMNMGVPKELLTGEKMLAKGTDIGNQLAQNIGIVFPYRIDNYCKIVCGMKHQGRYSDEKLNGNNFISTTEVTKEMFEDNLTEVTIEGGDTIEKHENMELVQISKMGEEWWFILRDIPAEELEQMALKAQLDYLSMMVDPEL